MEDKNNTTDKDNINQDIDISNKYIILDEGVSISSNEDVNSQKSLNVSDDDINISDSSGNTESANDTGSGMEDDEVDKAYDECENGNTNVYDDENIPIHTRVRFMVNDIKSKIEFYENNDKYNNKYKKSTSTGETGTNSNIHHPNKNISGVLSDDIINQLQNLIDDVGDDINIKIDMNVDSKNDYSIGTNMPKILSLSLPPMTPLPPLSLPPLSLPPLPPLPPMPPMPPLPPMTTSTRRIVIGQLRLPQRDSYSCGHCSLFFTSQIYLNDHLETVHCVTSKNKKYSKYMDEDDDEDDYDENEPCRCTKCGSVFSGDPDYKKHKCIGKLLNVDNIPTHIDGKFQCPICFKKYSTDNLLGEHFILIHNNFEEYTALDKKDVCDGFPGFDILKHINMIDEVKKKEWEKEMCIICYRHFKYSEGEYKINDKTNDLLKRNDVLKNNFSDSDLLIHDKQCVDNNMKIIDEKMNVYSYCLKNVFNRRVQVVDDDIIEVINHMRQTEVLPYKMTCCNTLICQECLKNNIMVSNSIICPFCKKDHENMELDYIRIYEVNNTIDSTKWIEWWKKHDDIYM